MSAGPLEIRLELVVYTIFTAPTNLIDPPDMEGAVRWKWLLFSYNNSTAFGRKYSCNCLVWIIPLIQTDLNFLDALQTNNRQVIKKNTKETAVSRDFLSPICSFSWGLYRQRFLQAFILAVILGFPLEERLA